MGREHYWFTVVPIREPEPGTDRWAIDNGWISITPLRLDLTDDRELEKLPPVAFASPNGTRLGKTRIAGQAR